MVRVCHCSFDNFLSLFGAENKESSVRTNKRNEIFVFKTRCISKNSKSSKRKGLPLWYLPFCFKNYVLNWNFLSKLSKNHFCTLLPLHFSTKMGNKEAWQNKPGYRGPLYKCSFRALSGISRKSRSEIHPLKTISWLQCDSVQQAWQGFYVFTLSAQKPLG